MLALDTNVIIELVRGRNPTIRRHFSEANSTQQPCATSLIVHYELLLGCELHHDPAAERERVRRVLFNVAIEPLDEPDIVAAARLRATLRRSGRPIGSIDTLIAGQALARDWTLVTANTREFARIEGLKVIDWTAS